MRITVFLSLLFIVASCSYFSPGPVSVENSFLKVSVDTRKNNFTVKSEKIDEIIVRNAEFFGKIESVEKKPVEESFKGVKGEGDEIRVSLEDGSEVALVLFDGSPFLHLHAKVHNSGNKALAMQSLELLNMDIPLDAEDTRSYGTGGLKKPSEDWPGSYTFHAFADPDTRNGIVSASLSHDRSIGIFFPNKKNGRISLKVQLDFGNFEVNPGETRPTDIIVLGYFDDARKGLEKYANAVAEYEDVELKPKPNVYCTWYHASASNEEDIAETAKFVEKHLKPFGLDVIQIDDNWQSKLPDDFEHEGKIETTGPVKVFVDTKDNYSKGMAYTAKEIDSHGLTPGIWFMPFAGNFQNPYFDSEIFAKNPDGTPFHDARWSGTCIDMSNPKAQKFVRQRVERIYDWGYRYFKLDGLHTGVPSYNIYINNSYKNEDFGKAQLHDSHTTHVQAYRKGLRIVRDAAPETFILGCNVSQNMRSMGPSFGLVDAMRIGPDNGGAANGGWNSVIRGAWHGTNRYFLNGRVWHNDPDPIYVRASNPLKKARWMCSWLAVSGSMHTSSENYPDLPANRLDLLKRTLPTHNLPARPVDLFETDKPRIWRVSNDRLNVIGLFNWQEKESTSIVYDMDKLGLEKNKTYVAFDYWADCFVDPFKNELNRELSPASCQVLAVRPQREHPQLLSTSRHITQGLMDVIDEKWEADSKTLSGTSELVGGDPYELRIALPPESSLKPEGASAKGADIKISQVDERGIRVTINSEKSQKVAWQVSFE